jgi:mono/diheme cytochrome c family protein
LLNRADASNGGLWLVQAPVRINSGHLRTTKKEQTMKISSRLVIVIVSLASVGVPSMIAAQNAPDGAALFKAKCAMCHGQDGAGKTAMGQKLNIRDLRSTEVQKQSDAELAKFIGQGKGKMPGYDNKISPDDIHAIVSHIRTLKNNQ